MTTTLEKRREWRRKNPDKIREHRRRYQERITRTCGHPDGCHKPSITNADGQLCSMHYNRLHRGSPLGPAQPLQSDKPSYVSAHEKVWKAKGKARQYPCVDCGDQAAEWSYDHADPDELSRPTLLRGQRVVMRYSVDVSHYEPRCKRCHAIFDKAQNKGDDE